MTQILHLMSHARVKYFCGEWYHQEWPWAVYSDWKRDLAAGKDASHYCTSCVATDKAKWDGLDTILAARRKEREEKRR